MERRDFIKTLGIMGGTAFGAKKLTAGASVDPDSPEFFGVLVDSTRCVGCRECEVACAEFNGLPEPDLDAAFSPDAKTTTTQWTVVKSTKDEEFYAKTQCMHCAQPACAAACPTKAMLKTPEGPVIWREDKCMGCRFCMLSCPFDIPKFEYDAVVPDIEKCRFCFDRLKDGEQPACTEACPEEAILFGNRRELLEDAHGRIHENPDDYVHHIYGEEEVGGTSWLYLSAVPFEEFGFRNDLDKASYPGLTTDFLYSVPIVLTLWPAFLLALSNATKRDDESEESEA